MNINIAIDGPAGSGKGTTAKELARRMNYVYLDSGAIYRSLTYYFMLNNISYNDFEKIIDSFSKIKIKFDPKNGHVILNGEDVEGEIRSMEVTKNVSLYATKSTKKIRDFVTEVSQKIVSKKGVVLEGRDATTVLAPNAELKIYLDADIKVRAERRYKEMLLRDKKISYNDVLKNLEERDKMDKKNIDNGKKNGILVDTSNITIEEQVQKIQEMVKKITDK